MNLGTTDGRMVGACAGAVLSDNVSVCMVILTIGTYTASHPEFS